MGGRLEDWGGGVREAGRKRGPGWEREVRSEGRESRREGASPQGPAALKEGG